MGVEPLRVAQCDFCSRKKRTNRPNFMPISGLLVTLRESAERTSAMGAIRSRAELTVGDLNDRWLPLALEARDDEHSRAVHDWLMALPGVEYVDVISVNFEESPATRETGPAPNFDATASSPAEPVPGAPTLA